MKKAIIEKEIRFINFGDEVCQARKGRGFTKEASNRIPFASRTGTIDRT